MPGHGQTDWLLSPIWIIVQMPEPNCFLWYRISYGTLQPCLGCQRAALLRGILRRENPTYTSWRRAARATENDAETILSKCTEMQCDLKATIYIHYKHCITHSGLCRECCRFCSVPSTWPSAISCRRNSASCSFCRSTKLPPTSRKQNTHLYLAYKCFFFAFWRQTNKRTDGQHRCTKPLSLSGAAA